MSKYLPSIFLIEYQRFDNKYFIVSDVQNQLLEAVMI